jgi:hypothetical protein
MMEIARLLEKRNGENYDLGAYGVFHLGRNHPKIKRVLRELLNLDRPNLIQMDCPLLSGLLAGQGSSAVSTGEFRRTLSPSPRR